MTEQFEPWVDLKGVHAHTRLSTSTLYHRINEIPHVKVGAKLLFKLSAVDSWMLKKHKAADESSDAQG